MSISFKAVLFDLDGTLIHSAPDLHKASNYVCIARGWESFDLETIVSFIGHGIPNLVKRIFEARGASVEEADYQTAVMDFLKYYDNHATDLTAPYEGAIEMLDQFQAQNIPMALVTNKPKDPALTILKALNMDHYFKSVIGGDSTAEKKPAPAPYMAACAELGVKPEDTVYVGDSETDGATAAAVSVPFVIYAHGYRNTPISGIPHWQQFEDFSNLLSILQNGRS